MRITPRPFSVALVFYCLPLVLAAGIRLQEYPYPFEEQIFAFASQGQELEMTYMEVVPERDARGTVVLLHGKNFSGAYWAQTAIALREEGYRVIMPDQVGFGKSSKPEHYHYTFHQLAKNTHALLSELGVEDAHIVGHSMGGMLAVRFALMYPTFTATLTLVNPLGLEDWKAMGVPYAGVDRWYEDELAQTPDSIRAYMRESYFGGEWKPEYEESVRMLAVFIASEDYERMAWNQALTYDMIFTQPVLYEFRRLSLPTLMIVGQRDRTALGRGTVSDELDEKLGRYSELGLRTAAAIKGLRLVPLRGLGHLPQAEDFDRFIEPLKEFLAEKSESPEQPAGGEGSQEEESEPDEEGEAAAVE